VEFPSPPKRWEIPRPKNNSFWWKYHISPFSIVFPTLWVSQCGMSFPEGVISKALKKFAGPGPLTTFQVPLA